MRSHLTAEQAAALIGVPSSTVRTWVQRGQLVPIRPGLYASDEVIECCLARTPAPVRARLHAAWCELVATGVVQV